jgi:hypothetical protein
LPFASFEGRRNEGLLPELVEFRLVFVNEVLVAPLFVETTTGFFVTVPFLKYEGVICPLLCVAAPLAPLVVAPFATLVPLVLELEFGFMFE